MKKDQIIGRVGAILCAIYFLFFITILMFILPSQGLDADQGALYDPQTALAFASNSWLLKAFYAHYLIGVIGFSLLVMSISKSVITIKPDLVKIANITGIIGIAFLFTNTVLSYLNIPLLVSLLAEHPSETYAAYLSITLIAGALVYGAFFCLGLWLILINIALLSAKQISRISGYIGIIVGAFGLISLFVTSFSFLYIFAIIIWLILITINFPKPQSEKLEN